jgi:Mg/Co/Ni transporter MgtE
MAIETNDSCVHLHGLLQARVQGGEIEAFLDSLPASELQHAVFHLTQDEQRSLLAMISAERAAEIVEELRESHAATLMELMPVAEVAPIVGEMASADRVDVLGELPAA